MRQGIGIAGLCYRMWGEPAHFCDAQSNISFCALVKFVFHCFLPDLEAVIRGTK